MPEKAIKVYGYRWVVLGVFFLINVIVQANWITFAPITGDAAKFYGVSELSIALLSMIFMIVYLVMSIPASYIVDTYGIRIGVGIGAALTGIFGLLRGIGGDSYAMVFAAQFGLAIAQPFTLNAVTAVAARWFPLRERATAAGIAVLAQLVGIGLAMALTPILYIHLGMARMLTGYGVVAVVSAVLVLVFLRERPPTLPGLEGSDARHTVFEGLKHIFKQRDMIILILIFFIGLGTFNAVTTWIEQILAPRGFSIEQAGYAGAVILVGCIVGAIVFSILSDVFRKRKVFIVVGVLLTIPGLVGLAYATSFVLLMVSSFVFGFFFMAGGPVGYQYSAEMTHPAPEATSQGLLVLAGQISGIIFIFGMDAFRTASGAMTPFMLAFVVMMVVSVILAVMLRESKMMTLHKKEEALVHGKPAKKSKK
jgi:MFS family permease